METSQVSSLSNIPIASFEKVTYIPKPFFYGSLTSPQRLQEFLQLPTIPVLTPAKARTYEIMLWGQYPALVDGPLDNIVEGMAFVVETKEQEKMLESYETDVNSITVIKLDVERERALGKSFIWAGNTKEFVEGTWTLEEWERGVEEVRSHFLPVED